MSLVTADAVASSLGCSRARITRLANDGIIPFALVDGWKRFDVEAVKAAIEEHEAMGVTAAVMAREIGWKNRTFRDWVSAGRIPFVHDGKRKLFSLEEVKKAIEARMPSEGHRVCSKCRREQLLECFSVGGKADSWCRDCRIEAKRSHRRATAARDGREFTSRATLKARREATKVERAKNERKRLAKVQEEKRLRKAARDAQLKAEGREGLTLTLAETKSRVDRMRERYANDPEYKAKVKAVKLRRRYAIAATQVVPINHIDIANRDGWMCAICRETVTLDNWSLDHIIPLSLGGPHLHSNVTLAHRRCNSSRGTKPYPEGKRPLPPSGPLLRAQYTSEDSA